jgi:hypothetical protein
MLVVGDAGGGRRVAVRLRRRGHVGAFALEEFKARVSLGPAAQEGFDLTGNHEAPAQSGARCPRRIPRGEQA